jgi:hypothetical protein
MMGFSFACACSCTVSRKGIFEMRPKQLGHIFFKGFLFTSPQSLKFTSIFNLWKEERTSSCSDSSPQGLKASGQEFLTAQSRTRGCRVRQLEQS